MKTIRILRKDFDAAIAWPWSPETCILEQASQRLGLDISGTDIGYGGNKTARRIMCRFDNNHQGKPTADKLARLNGLRASLPITIELA